MTTVEALLTSLNKLIDDASWAEQIEDLYKTSAYQGLNIKECQKEFLSRAQKKLRKPAEDLILLFAVTFERGTDTARLTGRTSAEERKALPSTLLKWGTNTSANLRDLYTSIVDAYDLRARIVTGASAAGSLILTPMRLTVCFPVQALKVAASRRSMPYRPDGAGLEEKQVAMLQTQAFASVIPERDLGVPVRTSLQSAHMYCQYQVSETINVRTQEAGSMTSWNQLTVAKKIDRVATFAALGIGSETVPEGGRVEFLRQLGFISGVTVSTTVSLLAEKWAQLKASA